MWGKPYPEVAAKANGQGEHHGHEEVSAVRGSEWVVWNSLMHPSATADGTDSLVW
jgi:hypothetical protein